MSKVCFSTVTGCLLSVASLAVTAQAETAELERLDTTYIASDTAIIVVAHPQRVLERKSKVTALTDQMLEMFKGQSGIDPKNLRQVVIQFGTETRNEDGRNRLNDEAITGVFRFDKPVNSAAIAATGFTQNMKTTHKGKTYYQPTSKYQPAVWFPDDRTMIIGHEWRVLKLMDEPSSMGLMVSRMRQADVSADLLVEVDVQRAEPLLQEAFRHAPEEEPFAPLKTIKKLKRVTLTAKLATDTPLTAMFQAKDAESAKQLQVKAETLLALAKTAWSKQRDMVRESTQGEEKKMVDAMIETVDTILTGTKFATDENHLAIRVEKKGGAVDLITLFMGMTMVRQADAKVEVEVRRAEAVKKAEEVKARVKAEEAAKPALEERKRAEEGKRAEERKRQER